MRWDTVMSTTSPGPLSVNAHQLVVAAWSTGWRLGDQTRRASGRQLVRGVCQDCGSYVSSLFSVKVFHGTFWEKTSDSVIKGTVIRQILHMYTTDWVDRLYYWKYISFYWELFGILSSHVSTAFSVVFVTLKFSVWWKFWIRKKKNPCQLFLKVIELMTSWEVN